MTYFEAAARRQAIALGNPTPANPAVPIRIFRPLLLVLVGAEAFSSPEITELFRRGHPAGRLSADVAVGPPVDQTSIHMGNDRVWSLAV